MMRSKWARSGSWPKRGNAAEEGAGKEEEKKEEKKKPTSESRQAAKVEITFVVCF